MELEIKNKAKINLKYKMMRRLRKKGANKKEGQEKIKIVKVLTQNAEILALEYKNSIKNCH